MIIGYHGCTMTLTEQQRDWLRLVLVPGIGTTYFIRLLARFRSPSRVLAASRSELKEVVGDRLAERVCQYGDVSDVDDQISIMSEYDAWLLTLEDSGYPVRLAEIYDPPLVLFGRGEFLERDEHCVAVVGTRKPTPYGVSMAEKFAGELAARGITVVSGMASGIDAAAHRGALDAGGRTIAILGNGVDTVFPVENDELMHRIIGQGAVMSSFVMGMGALKGNFPQRNRIISGMTLGTLVVEAPLRSGALITARTAAEQGREVFAVPGQIGVRNSQGPHGLIRDGAKLVETVDDLLVELEIPVEMRTPAFSVVSGENGGERGVGTASGAQRAGATQRASITKPKPDVSDVERAVLGVLAPDGSFVDEIALACRIPVSQALSSLTVLELKGLVRQFSGKRFAPR